MFLGKNEQNWEFDFESTLFKYIKKYIGVDYSDYVYYSTIFTKGMFTCKKRRQYDFKNCIIIKGFPHFEVPERILVKEIFDFLNQKKILKSDSITFFGGDTHIDKPVPRVAQLRGLILSYALSSMYKSLGVDSSFVYVIGDIGKRVESYILQEYGVLVSERKYLEIVKEISRKSKLIIKKKLKEMGFEQKSFVFMSDITNYSSSNIGSKYKIKDKIFRTDGSLRYLGQELCLIYYLNKNYSGNYILMLGGNQKAHADNIMKLAKGENFNLKFSYLIFEKVLNASERKYETWEKKVERYLLNNKFGNLNPKFFLKTIFTLFRQDSIQNVFAQSSLNFIKGLILILNNTKDISSNWKNLNYTIENTYEKELIYKLSLVNYQIFRSCTSFNPKIFYDYILEIAKFVDKHKLQINNNILHLANMVLRESVHRLNLLNENDD